MSRPFRTPRATCLLVVLCLGPITAWSKPGCTNADAPQVARAIALIEQGNQMPLADKLLSQAERRGNVDAAFNLGVFHMQGFGGKKDDYEAAKHFRIAAECGHMLAQFNLAQILSSTGGREVEAAKWFKAAADAGHTISAYNLGLMYAKGVGVEMNLDKARDYFSQAAEAGHLDATYDLGFLFDKPSDGKTNYKAAFHYYSVAAQHGHATAQARLGFLYLRGRGVPKDQNTGIYWLERSAKNGDKDAAEVLRVLGVTH